MSDYYYVETLIFLTPFKSTFMDPLAAYKSISRSLEHTTKQKIRKAAPAFVQKARGLTASDTIAAAAADSLKMALPSANPKQLGVLTIYLSGLVMAAGGLSVSREELTSKLDSMSEMGELDQLRLQMLMDRHSKLMTTLSNMLKKMSDTKSSITQNMK